MTFKAASSPRGYRYDALLATCAGPALDDEENPNYHHMQSLLPGQHSPKMAVPLFATTGRSPVSQTALPQVGEPVRLSRTAPEPSEVAAMAMMYSICLHTN